MSAQLCSSTLHLLLWKCIQSVTVLNLTPAFKNLYLYVCVCACACVCLQVVQKKEAHDYRCLFRVCFMPKNLQTLLQDDPTAFLYLYLQVDPQINSSLQQLTYHFTNQPDTFKAHKFSILLFTTFAFSLFHVRGRNISA